MVALSSTPRRKSFTVGVPVEVISKHTAVSAQVAKVRPTLPCCYGCCRAGARDDGNPKGHDRLESFEGPVQTELSAKVCNPGPMP